MFVLPHPSSFHGLRVWFMNFPIQVPKMSVADPRPKCASSECRSEPSRHTCRHIHTHTQKRKTTHKKNPGDLPLKLFYFSRAKLLYETAETEALVSDVILSVFVVDDPKYLRREFKAMNIASLVFFSLASTLKQRIYMNPLAC